MAEVFMPVASVRVATSTTVKRIALPAAANNCRLFNASSTEVAIQFDAGSDPSLAFPTNDVVTAAFTMGPGATENFRLLPNRTHISAILPSGASASTLSICMGEGE